MIVTLIPSGPISLDSDSEKPSTPNFAAAYGARPGGPMRPAMEVTWMMCPALRSRKYGSTALVMMMTPNRLVSICARKSASDVFNGAHITVAGIVHEHVQASEGCNRRLEGRLGLRFIGNIQRDSTNFLGVPVLKL